MADKIYGYGKFRVCDVGQDLIDAYIERKERSRVGKNRYFALVNEYATRYGVTEHIIKDRLRRRMQEIEQGG